MGEMLKKEGPESLWMYAQDMDIFAEGYQSLTDIIKGLYCSNKLYLIMLKHTKY